ncbi:E3 ubiquitin-protein ligase ZNRF2-like [Antedon mediterranea]|uniref:E3 ubiquitin-protein ligase ZNRF2-like n=1 Tax=Antedon mediterranea TaxID=105859 RepID=UPI003AF89D24
MGQKVSSSPRARTYSSPNSPAGNSIVLVGNGHQNGGGSALPAYPGPPPPGPSQQRSRTRSLGTGPPSGSPLTIAATRGVRSLDTDNIFAPGSSRLQQARSLPAHLLGQSIILQASRNGFKCPVCSKMIPSDDVECHLVMCLTKPRIVYNDDVLTSDQGECSICLDDMLEGNTIARLPCLCIYHKPCIDSWFEVNRSCPEHPTD